MPCDYKKYHPSWKQIVMAIRKRSGGRCEFCNAKNGKPHWKTGSIVVLTVAHIDQDINNNKPYNLADCCQRCHFKIDLPWNIRKRKVKNERDNSQHSGTYSFKEEQ